MTDADGDDALELTDGAGTRRIAAGELGRVLELAVAPDGATRRGGHARRRGCCWWRWPTAPCASSSAATHGDATGLAFSPDSAWLAWSHAAPVASCARSASPTLATGAVHDVTAERFVDTDPAFTLDGQHLAFLSARTFDPVYDTHIFDLSFTVGVRPYLVPLAADTPSPFDPETDGRPVAPPDDKPTTKDDDGGATPVRVDLDGLADRTVVVPVAGRAAQRPARGQGRPALADPPDHRRDRRRAARGREAAASVAVALGLRRPRAHARSCDALDWYQPCPATAPASSCATATPCASARPTTRSSPSRRRRPDASSSTSTSAASRCATTRPREWRQMMAETWRLMRDHFWIEDMGGVDWDDVLERYLPLVDRIATRDDLSEVLWEMIGELGSSHAYERHESRPRRTAGCGRVPRRRPRPRRRRPLAARARAAGRVVGARGAFAAARGRCRRARRRRAARGQRAARSAAVGPGPLLAGLAGKPVELTVARGRRRRAPSWSSRPATRRRSATRTGFPGAAPPCTSATDGRIGYVHVPDMMSTGWAEFHRDLRARDPARRPGARHPRQRRRARLASWSSSGWPAVRSAAATAGTAADETYPRGAPRGPIVSLANEYAGSDGDIVNEAFRELGLGPDRRRAHLGRRHRHRRPVPARRRHRRHPAALLVLVPRRRAGASRTTASTPTSRCRIPPQAWAAGDDPQLDRRRCEVLTDGAGANTTPLHGRRRCADASRPSRTAAAAA